MLRLLGIGGRAAAQRSHWPFYSSRSIYQTSRLGTKEGSEGLYSEVVAELQDSGIEPVREAEEKSLSPGKPLFNQLPENVEVANVIEQVDGAQNARKERGKPARPNDSNAIKELQRPKRKGETPKESDDGEDEVMKPKIGRPLKRTTPEKIPAGLRKNPWINLSRYLTAGYGGTQRRSMPLGDNKRIHVTSETLCDDVLQRLDPSLDKHIGCDILDLNPGICLWSSKLHDCLKPRTHILLEPDSKMYEPFIKPLLNAPGSTYKHIPKSGIVWGDLETVLSKEHLPSQEAYQVDDPRLHEPNNTLLVTANIGFYPKKAYRGFSSLETLVIYQFASAMRTKALFQRYGQVRLLVWLRDDERQRILPKDIHMRRKGSMEFDLACDVREVASTTNNGVYRNRISLDIMKAQETKRGMVSSGIQVPEGRLSKVLEDLEEHGGGVSSEASLLGVDRFTEEREQLEAGYAKGRFEKYLDPTTTSMERTNGGRLKRHFTPEYMRLSQLRIQAKQRSAADIDHSQRISQFKALLTLQKKIHAARLDGTVTEAQEDELQEMIQTMNEDLALLHEKPLANYFHSLDNHLAFNAEPPLLMFDQRETEPLRVHSNEFYPKGGIMCLLDFQPKSLWPILQQDPKNYDVFEFITGSIFMTPTQSVKRALQSLWPGAYDYLVAECPSLTDPNKGGNLDLDLLRVRVITLEMLEEMVEAWIKWPFKPTKYEIVARMGNELNEDDDDD